MSAVTPWLQQALHPERTPPPDADFPLWHPREQTLRRRCQALFVAPLVGLETLTACETHTHPLPTRLGRGDHRATLTPCLGPRARLDAAGALLPALRPPQVGQRASVEGPMIASGRRGPMPQGTSTMRGRSRAGSPAVIAPAEAGPGRLVASHPPDQHLSPCMVASGQQGALATGRSGLVIDRAVHARALARAFAHQDLGRLCMRDDHAPHGLERCAAPWEETRPEGPKGDRGPWQRPRAEAPRPFVMVAPVAGKPVVSWGTPRGQAPVEPTAWPQGDRERSARQEHSFPRLLDPGALTTHAGRKKMRGADRHPPRVRAQRAPALEAAQKRVEKPGKAGKTPQAQGVESAATGPGKRLEQRQRTLAVVETAHKDAPHQHRPLAAHAAAVGPSGERAERDCRTQTRMPVRTLR